MGGLLNKEIELDGVSLTSTLHRAPVGQGPSGPDWLAISFGFWSGRALATGTAWAGLCLIHHHHHQQQLHKAQRTRRNQGVLPTRRLGCGGGIAVPLHVKEF